MKFLIDQRKKLLIFIFSYDAQSIAMKGMESWTHDDQG